MIKSHCAHFIRTFYLFSHLNSVAPDYWSNQKQFKNSLINPATCVLQKEMRFTRLACGLVWWLLVWYSGRACCREPCTAEGLEPAWGPARDDYSVDTYSDRYMGESEVYALFRAVVCGAQRVLVQYRGQAAEELLNAILQAKQYTELWGQILLGLQAVMLAVTTLIAVCCRRCGCGCPRLDAEQPGQQGQVHAGGHSGRVVGRAQAGSQGLRSGQVHHSLPQMDSSPPRQRDRISLFNMGRPAVQQPSLAQGSPSHSSASIAATPMEEQLQYGDLYSSNVYEMMDGPERDSLSYQSSFTFGDFNLEPDSASHESIPDLEPEDDDKVWREGCDLMETPDLLQFAMEVESVPGPAVGSEAGDSHCTPVPSRASSASPPLLLQSRSLPAVELLAAQQHQSLVDSVIATYLREVEIEDLAQQAEQLQEVHRGIDSRLENLYRRVSDEYDAMREERDKLERDMATLNQRMDDLMTRSGPSPNARPVSDMGEVGRRISNLAQRMELCKRVALSHSRVSAKESVLMEEYARQHSSVGWQMYSKRLGLSRRGGSATARRLSREQDLENFLALTERVATSLLQKVNELSADQSQCRSEMKEVLRIECPLPELPDMRGVEDVVIESPPGSPPPTPDLSAVPAEVFGEPSLPLVCSRSGSDYHLCPDECDMLLELPVIDSEEENPNGLDQWDGPLERESKDEY